MDDDIVRDLRALGCGTQEGSDGVPIMVKAADEIVSLRRRLESQGQIIRAMAQNVRDADRAFSVWVQAEWERDHPQGQEPQT